MLRNLGRLSVLATAITLSLFINPINRAYPQDNPDFVVTELLFDVTDTLQNYVAAAIDTHKVGFTTTLTPLGNSSLIWITFPAGFNIIGVSDVDYYDNDGTNNFNEPWVVSWNDVGQTLKCLLSSGSQPAVPPGSCLEPAY